MDSVRERFDVVVVGAGMAGVVAAARCVELDRSVLVVEKGPEVGGSMRLSGGHIWTFADEDELREKTRGGNRDLQRVVVTSFRDGLRWLDDQGVELAAYDSFQGVGKKCDPEDLIETLRDRISAGGGAIRVNTELTGLERDDGGVRRVRARDTSTGTDVDVRSESVVLATGGFQGNRDLVERHITGTHSKYWLRSNPWSTGGGLRAARDIGAATSDGMDGFYGHNLVAPPADVSAEAFMDATQYYGPLAVALDEDGTRFVDESRSAGEEYIAQATARRAGGRAVYVIDRDVYETEYGRPVAETIANAEKLDGPVHEADDEAALRDRLDEWGVDGDRALETLSAFNAAVRNDATEALDPPRRRHRHQIDTPPFYAVLVQPGITFTAGGLAVSEDMEVLEAGPDPAPIENLWAAGADVGAIHSGGYMGGLATALVTGLRSGTNAARNG